MLQLPFDFPRTPGKGPAPERHTFELSAPAVAAGEALRIATFCIQLHRYTGQSTLSLSVSRWRAGSDNLTTSRLCLEIAPGATCRSLIDQFDRQPPSRGIPEATEDAGGGSAAVTMVESGDEEPPTKLLHRADLHLILSPDGKRASYVYDANLFKRSTIVRFAGHLGVLLAHAGERLDTPVSQLPLLTAEERAWLDAASQGRPRTAPFEPLHQRIERHAAATPDAVAVSYREGRFTYRELNRRANQLARLLVSRGIGAECFVAVCLEPSFDIAIALLGILKAGAVYVPVDPTYPRARIGAILDDIRPKAILSRSHLIEKLELQGSASMALDASEDLLDAESGEDLATAIAPSQTAYVYYTSGTTGRPKGVMASHANLRSYIQVAQDRYQFRASDVMPAIARFSFSISMFELMSPLAAGGTLVVLDRDHVLDVARMSKTLGEVTFFHMGPSLLKNVLAHIRQQPADPGAFSGVRHASSGGDMIAPELLEALNEVFPNAEVFVIYGCSEISCMGCTYPVPRERTVTKTYVGRPFDDTVVRVLDGELHPVPVGVVGEIHFAGGGVVKGYLDRPELTAEKFVAIEGRRFYRTGDMGRLSDDGWVEILGRNDFQIKIRGMRIELGEVEHTLRRAPGVRDGVVVARGTGGTRSGEKSLVAYVVLGDGARTSDEAARRATMSTIRAHMVDTLPDYMVPAVYVELASLPLNLNMKVDRNALPEPEASAQRAPTDALREPETPTERKLASLWQKLLAVKRVGLDDNFFELGGDSMLAMGLLVEVERELAVKIDGMDVLRESLEVLAAICDRLSGSGKGAPARAPGPRASAKPATHVPATETFYFGAQESLYGVLHPGASGLVPANQTVLICAPLGQEHVRASFVLNRLARALSGRGMPVLQFDYYGCVDSLGESVDATCDRWLRDVEAARRELERRTGTARVTAIGVRFGATLLSNAAFAHDVARLVLWDPVDGADYYAELTRMNQRYLRSVQHLRLGRSPRPIRGAEEILGSIYSDAMLREMKALRVRSWPGPVKGLVTARPTREAERLRAATAGAGTGAAGSRIEALAVDCGWHDLSRLEDLLPDVGIVRALATMVTEEP